MYLIKEDITFEKALSEINKLLLSYIDHDNDCEGIYYLLVKLNDETKEILESLINNKEEYIEEFKSEDNSELDIIYLWSMIDIKFKKAIFYNSKENVFFQEVN